MLMAESFISCHCKYCTEYYYVIIIIIAIIVCSTDYTIICLSETLLNDLCYNQCYFSKKKIASGTHKLTQNSVGGEGSFSQELYRF
jgi:hypothetical protein